MRYIFIVFILFFLQSVAFSQDRIFAYTYQTNVLNKGDIDMEFQNTLATGKKGLYSPYVFGRHLNQRLEFEVGLGKKVQTSFYLNSELFNYADTSSKGLNQELKISFSNEWKWKLSDPVANAIGFALYEELEFGGNNFESETKLIFDKRWQNDLVAFNIVGKYEIEREISRANNVTKAEWTHNSPVEFDFGYMHFFKPEISFGLEIRNNNDIRKEDGWVNSVLFAGPAFHVSVGKFFTNITALPQIINLHKTDAVPGNRDLNDFEQVEGRVLIGYSL
ncbi:MAG: hypothetical protein KGM16_10810 [Bacteroidota bacterium]|nr:hypothetical protein [Bacteroidota bacterium]